MLAACYLVHGGEPLQTEEFILQIRQLAAKHGYNNYMVFEVNAQFDWDELLNKCQNLDLFAERSVVELRLHSENIGKPGSQALEKLLQEQSRDVCTVIRAPKLKAQTLNSSWVKLIQKSGKVQFANPKNNSRFSVFDLTAAAINGDCERTFSIFQSLRNEGVDPVLVLWGLTREIRNLLQLSYDIHRGASLAQSAQQIGIWRERLPNIKIALERLNINKLQNLLKISKNIDCMIKGISPGNAWEPLLSVCMILASSKTLTMEDLNI